MGVVVNTNDPQSVAVADYYVLRRGIPPQNVVRVAFPPGTDSLSVDDFKRVRGTLDASLAQNVQAIAITWTRPFRVDCVSITNDITYGFDPGICVGLGQCGAGYQSVYYAAGRVAPLQDMGIRPSMVLAGASAEEVYALIDRGIAAEQAPPTGTAYLVTTTDYRRSVRDYEFAQLQNELPPATGIAVQNIDNSKGAPGGDYISGKQDVLFYFTGLASVPDLQTNRFLPGAMADHLTSYGGQLLGSPQMSAVSWLQAGATASYGTALEPCNYPQKFPDPSIAVPDYFRGDTALEAYWKSVQWPTQGVFVGEPLARPFAAPKLSWNGRDFRMTVSWLDPQKIYQLKGAQSPAGPFTVVLDDVHGSPDWSYLAVGSPAFPYYRIDEKNVPGIDGLQVRRVTDTSVEIGWRTAVPASTGWEMVDIFAGTRGYQSVSSPVTDHAVIISPLPPSTTFWFRVFSETPDKIRGVSRLIAVTTAPAGIPTPTPRPTPLPTPRPTPVPTPRPTPIPTPVPVPQDAATVKVTQWYVAYLHRQPDGPGLSGFAALLRAGHPPHEVQSIILGSDEYFGLHGKTAAGVARAIFIDVTGRAATTAAQRALVTGFTRQPVSWTTRVLFARSVLDRFGR
jgi:uncharacterized protein (TIGR03790 family)